MKKHHLKSGVTLVEVMLSIVLVGVAASIIYTEVLLAHRTLMRSRARLEAQNIAADYLWEAFNTSLVDLPSVADLKTFQTPEGSLFETLGTIDIEIYPEIEAPLNPELIESWQIIVTVFGQEGSPVQIGDEPLAKYEVLRCRGER